MKLPSQKDEEEGRSQAHRRLRCPTCKRIMKVMGKDSSEQRTFFPFCSERCKLIDLGAWLDADYRIPSTPDEDSDGPPDLASSSSQGSA